MALASNNSILCLSISPYPGAINCFISNFCFGLITQMEPLFIPPQ